MDLEARLRKGSELSEYDGGNPKTYFKNTTINLLFKESRYDLEDKNPQKYSDNKPR
jgi:hypothetical protein